MPANFKIELFLKLSKELILQKNEFWAFLLHNVVGIIVCDYTRFSPLVAL
jgi:hypothetical protein